MEEEEIIEEVYDEARILLEETKQVIEEAKKQGKEVVYYSDCLLILSLEENSHIIYEVSTLNKKDVFSSKVVYIGDPKLRASYLLNLINKQELKVDPPYKENG